MNKRIECPHCRRIFSKDEVLRKKCSKCGRWKKVSLFYSKSNICKRCKFGFQNRSNYRKTTIRQFAKDGTLLKRCSKCKKWVSIDNFVKALKTKDGRTSWCKKCYSKDQIRVRRIKRQKIFLPNHKQRL